MSRRWEGTTSKLGAELSPAPALPAPPTSRPGPPAAETDPLLWGAQGTPGGASTGVGITHRTDEPWAPSHRRSGHYHWGIMGNTAEKACASLELGEDVLSCSVMTDSL